MTNSDVVLAEEIYEAAIEAPTKGGLLRAGRNALAVATATAGIPMLGPDGGDLVVRFKADGAQILRVDAGEDLEAGALLSSVRAQLATLTAAEFHNRWAIRA